MNKNFYLIFLLSAYLINCPGISLNPFVSEGEISIFEAQCYQWASDVGISASQDVRNYYDDNGNLICSCLADVDGKSRGQAFRLEGQSWIPLQ